MSTGIEARTGPYLHASHAKWAKEFEGGRKFSVLVAGAYDAGIVGPENNGVVVLDENNESVVLDRHVEQPSGYSGPSETQMREAKRIMSMDWEDFSEFCREHPRYRGSLADAHNSKPDTFEPLSSEVIFANSGKDESELQYFPLEKKDEIIAFLREHAFHRDGPYSKFMLAWDIKANMSFDSSGKHEDFETDPQFDERWAKKVEEDGSLFHQACEEATSYLFDGEYTTYPGSDQGDYGFESGGRSGGWLHLTKVEGVSDRLGWDSRSDFTDFLMDLEDHQLSKLYRIVAQLDHDITPARIKSNMEYQYSVLREHAEADWKDELEHENDVEAPAP